MQLLACYPSIRSPLNAYEQRGMLFCHEDRCDAFSSKAPFNAAGLLKWMQPDNDFPVLGELRVSLRCIGVWQLSILAAMWQYYWTCLAVVLAEMCV
jgi:hypothetical protein